MRTNFEYMEHLQYMNRSLEHQLDDFRSGKAYRSLEEKCNAIRREKDAVIRSKDKELASLRRQLVQNRENWFEVFEDMEAESRRRDREHARELRKLTERVLRAERQRDEALDTVASQKEKLREAREELNEEKEKVQKLKAQVNRDYENSSIPSSGREKKKKITNNREKTGRKPGAQPGHKAHPRKKQEPTEPPVLLDPPQEVKEDPHFKKTKQTLVKQLVGIHVCLVVKEFHADVYYNSQTGERIHAPFPKGVVNDVNYDGSIKAFLFLLNNDCCISIDKSRKFLSDLTSGKLNISKGMINKLSREFARKTDEERGKVFQRILTSPVMHTDSTNARESGKHVNVYICATPDGEAMYFAREKKGHEGVKGTPVEDYQGILVHDHEITFYNYGAEHQECLAHVLRYLKGSMENEPGYTWNEKMHKLIQEMIHYRKSISPEEEHDGKKVPEYEKRYREILLEAKKEYEKKPSLGGLLT